MILDTIQYKGCTIEMHSDEDAESPREWDNLGTMLCRHRDYILGDRKRGEPEPDVETIIALTKRPDVLWLPLYLYDHSGITMRAGAPTTHDSDWMRSSRRFIGDDAGWDTSTVGIIYVTYARLRQEYGRLTAKRKWQAYAVLDGEVRTYDSYLRGEVVGFVAKGPEGDAMDSCWGFYPEHQRGRRDYDHMLTEAETAIDAYWALQARVHS
jgi:hypothetical protein